MIGPKPRRAVAIVATIGALVLLSACSPLFIPLVPRTIAPEPRFELTAESLLWWDAERLRADLWVAEVPEAGWLAVQWRDPSGVAVASDSVWVPADGAGVRYTLVAPPEIAPDPSGERWHATITFGADLVRQLSTSAEPEPVP